MNGDPLESDYISPAEVRLGEHLTLLRRDPPRSDRSLVVSVLRTARWQRPLRGSLLALAGLAGAVASGIQALLRPKARRR